MDQELVLRYRGFCGQVHLPLQPGVSLEECGSSCEILPIQWDEDRIIQYIQPSSQERFVLLSNSADYVLLAGLFYHTGPFSCHITSLVEALKEGRYEHLPSGEYCGCLVTKETIWFFKTRSSNETVFYAQHGGRIRWSTNPLQVVSAQNLSEEALARCCTGEDTFVYRDLEVVEAGTVVRMNVTTTHKAIFEKILPLSLPQRVSLQDVAVCCYDALKEATLPLAASDRKIGVLLSGGIDSAAIAAALVLNGAHVVAYHFYFPGVANEIADAQAVCQALDIPLHIIPVSNGSDYLSDHWHFVHPYNHAGLRWFEQVAEQASQDGITLLTTGRGGDPSFGPLATYGLSDVFAAPIAWGEKWAMVMGAISTDWLFSHILKSLHPSYSLINERSLTPTYNGQQTKEMAPFLRQHEFPTQSFSSLYETTRFSPQDLTVEATIWQPYGIRMVHPYHHSAIQRLAASLPAAYRLLPYRGRKVVKPVLRWAFADTLPPRAVRQRRGPWLSVPHQEYCIDHTRNILQLIGSTTSQVVQRGIVDPIQLQHVMSSPKGIRAYYKEILATAMTELFLRQICRATSHANSPIKKA